MATEYSIETCKQLEQSFNELNLLRPMRITHYDAGTELEYTVTPVEPGPQADVKLSIEKFVGGGFAGQVYKVKLLSIQVDDNAVEEHVNLRSGHTYAMKILIPPSDGSLLFRNFVYAVGFQAPFQLQVNPAAARAGALWQKFIRTAAQEHFNDPYCVNDIHATFVDSALGSCGEFSDWVEGRTWRLEVDDHMDRLKHWRKRKPVDETKLSSPEFRSKYKFMTEFVTLLHEIGAPEFARQYEWTTCKSQPNALKRMDTNNDPTTGLIAVDFRAGLALLPFLPMSPGDFKLIWLGLKRGSLVQFDRGNITKLKQYLNEHSDVSQKFSDTNKMLEELEKREKIYRDSIPDITHNHVRLLNDGQLWNTLFNSAVTGWTTRNLLDDDKEASLRTSKIKTFFFFLLGLIPIVGKVFRKLWTKADWRKHYLSLINPTYLVRAFTGRMYENLIKWHRSGRIDEARTLKLKDSIGGYILHRPLSFLPAGLHRFLTDPQILKNKLYFLFARPFKLYFDAKLREQWLRDMVVQGKKKHILSDEDADTILSQVNEPFIQKYLVSLVVHVMTLPVTQVVSVIVAAIFYWTHPDMPQGERAAAVAAILVFFQIIPVSPGSFCRGAYVVYMMIKDRNFKDYNIAVFLGFFKYVGYLAFPIQMTYRYPAMARFMAAHWATDAVHVVPVFGERGALFEHWIFCLFYNWPLTIRRRMKRISEVRADLAVRIWHTPVIAALAAGLFSITHYAYYLNTSTPPTTDNKWYLKPLFLLFLFLPPAAGWAVTSFAGGLSRVKRIISGTTCGLLIGITYSTAAYNMEQNWQLEQIQLIVPMVWRSFALAIFCTIGVLIAEIKKPDPDLKKESGK